MRGLFRLPPSRSAQVRLSLPRSIPTCRLSQVRPGSPRFSQEIRDFLRFCGFPGFPGRTWVLFSALLWGFRDFLGEHGCYFLGFRDFLGEPGRYFLRFCGVSGISWENLGGNSWGWAWESCKSQFGESGWRVARYFDPQFLKFLPQALPPPLACRFATL